MPEQAGWGTLERCSIGGAGVVAQPSSTVERWESLEGGGCARGPKAAVSRLNGCAQLRLEWK
jgi:hypothetical protein